MATSSPLVNQVQFPEEEYSDGEGSEEFDAQEVFEFNEVRNHTSC